MGGSQGHVAIAIAEKFPTLHFVVQDLPSMRTAEVLAAIPESMRDRMTLTTQKNSTPQPDIRADVFFFRHIFHNWPDLRCIKILRNLIPGMKKGTRDLINDDVSPEPGTMRQFEDKLIRWVASLFRPECLSDCIEPLNSFFMLVTVNACEREAGD